MILVTGATGFVGRHVVLHLLSRGQQTRCLVRNLQSPEAKALAANGAEIVEGDVTVQETITRAAQGTEAIVHLVSIIRPRGSATFPEVNYRGTLHVIDAATTAQVRRLIHVSALGADPSSPFPFLRSMGLANEAVRQSSLDYTIVRPSIIFGEGDGFVRMIAALVKALPVVPIVGGGQNLVQPVWVGDVAVSIGNLLEDRRSFGQSYDLAGPDRLTYQDIVGLVRDTLRARRLEAHVPIVVIRPIAAAMARMLPAPPVTPDLVDLLEADSVTQKSATAELIGRPARPLAGNIDYVKSLSQWDSVRAVFGFGLP